MDDLDLPDYFCRIASYTVELWDVLGDNTASTNCATSANGYSWKYDNITTKPTILTNINWLAKFRTIDTISEKWIERMGSTVEGTVRTDQCSSSNSDGASVNPDTIEIDVDALAEPKATISLKESSGKRRKRTLPEVEAVVYLNWRIDIWLVSEQLKILFF